MKTKYPEVNVGWVKLLTLVLLAASALLMTSCDDEDPEKEDVPELITKVTLTFTPVGGSSPTVTATATDPDGEGVNDLAVDGPINLASTNTYVLTIGLTNELANPGENGFDVAEEVEEEGDEHMFFFGWTGEVFFIPDGNGNIDNRADEVSYQDEDENGLPLGLITRWTTSTASSGNFRVILKHQPGVKTATSDANTGETDVDVTFVINVN